MIFRASKDLKAEMNDSEDVVIKEISCSGKEFNLVFIKTMIDEKSLTYAVISPLIDYYSKKNNLNNNINIKKIKNEILRTLDVKLINKKESINELSSNKVLLIIQGEPKILSIDIIKYPIRTPSEPPTSAVVKGPREGFVEDMNTNISLIRKRFNSQELTVKQMSIGKRSQTKISIVYLNQIVSVNLVKRIEKKLKKINIDGVIDSYYLIPFLQNNPSSMFKQVGNCEKPDIISAKLLEGRVAIIVDNSPIVLTLPFMFIEDLQNSNDYYSLSQYATYIRVIRILGLLFSVIIPGTYISFRLYHYNIVPINFLVTIANSTASIPLTPFLEVIFILILFEILYEVSLRLPRYLGLATSIVGALVLGDTGVKAGLISPPGVMVIALSTIAVYTIPDQVDQINLLRATFIVLGGALGLFGIIAGFVFVIAYLNSLENYGVGYLAPFSPKISSDLKDGVIKSNIIYMKERPKSIKNKNKTRMKYDKDN